MKSSCLHCECELDESDVEVRDTDAQVVCAACGTEGPIATVGCRDPEEEGPIDLVQEALQLHSESHAFQRIEVLEKELAEVKAGYHALDENWSSMHEVFGSAIRGALKMPDATVPELVAAIEKLRQLEWRVVHNAGRRSPVSLPRNAHVRSATGHGSTEAAAMCKRHDLNPDEEVGGDG